MAFFLISLCDNKFYKDNDTGQIAHSYSVQTQPSDNVYEYNIAFTCGNNFKLKNYIIFKERELILAHNLTILSTGQVGSMFLCLR